MCSYVFGSEPVLGLYNHVVTFSEMVTFVLPSTNTFICTSCTLLQVVSVGSVVCQQIELMVSQHFLGSLCGTQSRGRGWLLHVCLLEVTSDLQRPVAN